MASLRWRYHRSPSASYLNSQRIGYNEKFIRPSGLFVDRVSIVKLELVSHYLSSCRLDEREVFIQYRLDQATGLSKRHSPMFCPTNQIRYVQPKIICYQFITSEIDQLTLPSGRIDRTMSWLPPKEAPTNGAVVPREL